MGGSGVIGLLGFPLGLLMVASFMNNHFNTQAALYTLVIVAAIAAGTIAGVTVIGTGGNAALTIIIFLETALGALYVVLFAGNFEILNTVPFFTYLYTVASFFYILGMVLAPRMVG